VEHFKIPFEKINAVNALTGYSIKGNDHHHYNGHFRELDENFYEEFFIITFYLLLKVVR
jgi:hypothetical protein